MEANGPAACFLAVCLSALCYCWQGLVVEAAESPPDAESCRAGRTTVRLAAGAKKVAVVVGIAVAVAVVAYRRARSFLGLWEVAEWLLVEFALGSTGKAAPLAVQAYGWVVDQSAMAPLLEVDSVVAVVQLFAEYLALAAGLPFKVFENPAAQAR